MILISHRGNTVGRFESWENEPTYIDKAINEGYDVEVDVWYKDKVLFLGHDKPDYGVNLNWFIERSGKLWIHCKNIEAVLYFNQLGLDLHYFWHQNDTITLTSKNYIWAFPGNQPIKNSISVLPEQNDDDTSFCLGICSDFIEKYNIE